MKTKILFTLLYLVAGLAANSSSYRNKIGGIQLLMTIEHQKKVDRIVDYIDIDLKEFFILLDQNLYQTINGQRVKKQQINLSEDALKKIKDKSKSLAENLDELSESLKSIYFNYGKDDYYKKQINSLKLLHEKLKKGINVKDGQSVSSIHDNISTAKQSILALKRLVREAKLANEEEIKKRIETMSVFEWLFGYP